MAMLNADSAVTAAGAALWTWHAADGRLSIRAEAGGPLGYLDGRWRLDSFLGQIDGLARGLIVVKLRDGKVGDPVDARITLTDGRPAHFVGSFYDAGVAPEALPTPPPPSATPPPSSTPTTPRAADAGPIRNRLPANPKGSHYDAGKRGGVDDLY
jgi:hypothetical protein